MSDDLNVSEILPVLNESDVSLESVFLFENIDSTNDWCLEQCKDGRVLPFACIADVQNKGRGRRGHQWVSEAGSSITMSFATTFDLEVSQLGMLSLAMGMAVSDVLRALGMKDVALKWPNDVLVSNQKIAGILVETVMVHGKLNVVVGVGVNYNMKQIRDDTENEWTDIVKCLGSELKKGRSWLAGELLKACFNRCEKYPMNFDFLSAEFDSDYNAFINEAVKVMVDGDDFVHGTCTGTSAAGELKVLVDGKEQVFSSAEISLRRAVEC